MGQGRTVIHTNCRLAHQIAWAEVLQAGFKRHGLDAAISASPDTPADFHVVMGPWFALEQWKHHPQVLYLDRAYWGDPNYCSLHWLRAGEKAFTKNDAPRNHPTRQPEKIGNRRLVLCDYQMDGKALAEQYDADIRLHPNDRGMMSSDKASVMDLHQQLDQYDIAIGRRTTALIDAYILGLTVISDYFGSINLKHLAWHNWSHVEIANGEAWQYLTQSA